jgi:hypothetical protein
LLTTGGDMVGELNMNGYKIHGLNLPESEDQAVNKGYTDAQITDRVILSGGKNLLQITSPSTTVNGVTFTVNEDSSVTVNGTATSVAVFSCPVSLRGGVAYTLTGSPAGSSMETYRHQITNLGNDFGDGLTATPSSDSTEKFNIIVTSGATANNVTFYPMLRLASVEDGSYEPYYDKGLADLNRAITHGSKNLLKVTGVNTTKNGVAYTNNYDGTITINGTSTGETADYVIGEVFLKAGKYIVSSLTGTSTPECWIYVGDNKIGQSNDKEATITLTQDSVISVNVYQSKTGSYSNVVLKPMIRIAGSDDTYEPYYEGLAELTYNHVLLWENAQPDSDFDQQPLSIDCRPYRRILVVAKTAKPSPVYTTAVNVVGETSSIVGVCYDSENGVIFAGYRPFGTSSKTKIDFSRVVGMSLKNTTVSSVSANITYMIPIKIYGIK